MVNPKLFIQIGFKRIDQYYMNIPEYVLKVNKYLVNGSTILL